ncbi:MAG: hypothetical protein ABSF59_05165 [Candidatus Sulfotelmatobacter sp.]
MLFDETSGFSAVMKMFSHDPGATLASRSFGGVKEWTTRAPMLALGDPDPSLAFPGGTTLQPKLLVRNASAKSFTGHLRFSWRSATASGKTAPINLPFTPNQTQMIDVSALQAQRLLPADAHWAAAILSAPVQPDDLLAIAASYDQTGRYGAQTPFSDQLASHWEAGKWEVDGMHNSLVTVGNGGNQPQRAQLTILYDQGRSKYQVEQNLGPDEQMAFDFGKLIRDQIPDKNGHTLPLDLTYGGYRILDLSDGAAGTLYEGKVILDKTYGHAAYGCALCCNYETPFMVYNPLPVSVDATSTQQVQAGDSCGGGNQIITEYFPTWWTDNTAIATANRNIIRGVSAGTTNHHAQSEDMYWGRAEYFSVCPLTQEQPSAPTNVGCPSSTTVSSLTPLSITLLFPGLKTGIGAVSSMLAGPAGTSWNGSEISEALATVSNSCPANWGNLCAGSSTFTVGEGGQAEVSVGGVETPVGPVFPEQQNVFYDQHTLVSNVSLLPTSSGQTNCTAVCSQTYSCNGIPVGNHTITYSFIEALITGTHVTSTEVSEQ